MSEQNSEGKMSDNIEQVENKTSIFKVYPTYTSVINIMDKMLDPRIALGIIQGNEDLKRLNDFSYVHKINVLSNIDEILKSEIEHIDVPQVAYYFRENVKKDEETFANLSQLSNQYSAHVTRKVEKIKQKPMLTPQPGDTGITPKQREELENRQKHEMAHKNSLKNMTPFKIPKPMKS